MTAAMHIICLPLVAALLFLLCPPPAAASGRIAACSGSFRTTCVVDGDTLWWRGEKIRLLGIDTPELEHPACPGPASGSTAARERLIDLINAATQIEVVRDGRDRYGRTLAHLVGDGVDLGTVLLNEGFARVYVPGEQPWC